MGIAINPDATFLLLCEGQADCNFFRTLHRHRNCFPGVQIESMDGRDNLASILDALLLDPPKVKQLRGILVVYDAADNPDKTFEAIKKRIGKTDFQVPTKLFDARRKTDDLPLICVMLVPDDKTPGGLETLCNEFFESKHSWIKACVDAYMSCGKSSASTWPPEKRDKARFAAMVAVANRDDPSKAISHAFSSDSGIPPLIPVSAPNFNGIVDRIKDYCARLI